MSANIFCVECGSRPFPQLSLPTRVREDFDLLKIGGEWRCSRHRGAKPVEPKAKLSRQIELKSRLDELSRFVAHMSADEGDLTTALELIDRMGALVERSR